jgi:hypothetical protein
MIAPISTEAMIHDGTTVLGVRLLLHERQRLADDAGVVAEQEAAQGRQQRDQRDEPVAARHGGPYVLQARGRGRVGVVAVPRGHLDVTSVSYRRLPRHYPAPDR